MTTRKTPRENDFATLKQVIEAVGPCAMAIEELDGRMKRLEEEAKTRIDGHDFWIGGLIDRVKRLEEVMKIGVSVPYQSEEAVSISLQNSSTSPETP